MGSKETLLQELTELIARGEEIAKNATYYPKLRMTYCDSTDFYAWRSEIFTLLQKFNLNKSEYYVAIYDFKKPIPPTIHNIYPENVEFVIKQLTCLRSQIQKDLVSFDEANTKPSSSDDLENILNKFHSVARQLRTRYKERETLTIKDEYDVQDLLHALLLLHFDDVRAEEWTPSYAGGCERMDFLLKDLQTVIEVKKTRETMNAKKLGEELIIDIEKYQVHQDCKQIYCFVYDPEGYLGNPTAIKNDLEKAHDGFVKIFIRPNL